MRMRTQAASHAAAAAGLPATTAGARATCSRRRGCTRTARPAWRAPPWTGSSPQAPRPRRHCSRGVVCVGVRMWRGDHGRGWCALVCEWRVARGRGWCAVSGGGEGEHARQQGARVCVRATRHAAACNRSKLPRVRAAQPLAARCEHPSTSACRARGAHSQRSQRGLARGVQLDLEPCVWSQAHRRAHRAPSHTHTHSATYTATYKPCTPPPHKPPAPSTPRLTPAPSSAGRA